MTKSRSAPTAGGAGRVAADPGATPTPTPTPILNSTPTPDPDPSPAGHCAWCRRALPERSGPGRPRRFCSQRCRQWDWVARQRARELQLSEDELVVARSELDALHDELYVLACAVDDVERDLAVAGRRTTTQLADAVQWLLAAARPLRDREIGPSPPAP